MIFCPHFYLQVPNVFGKESVPFAAAKNTLNYKHSETLSLHCNNS